MDSLFKWNADIKNVEHKLPATELYETIPVWNVIVY
jgi:hypothetical protein